jgi:hypothetical protein
MEHQHTEEKGSTRTTPCRDNPRLVQHDAPGQDSGRSQGYCLVPYTEVTGEEAATTELLTETLFRKDSKVSMHPPTLGGPWLPFPVRLSLHPTS